MILLNIIIPTMNTQYSDYKTMESTNITIPKFYTETPQIPAERESGEILLDGQTKESLQEKNQEFDDLHSEKKYAEIIVRLHMKEVSDLKDEISRETNIDIIRTKTQIMIDTIQFFKKKLKYLEETKTSSVSDNNESTEKSEKTGSVESSNCIDSDDVSSEDTYYSNTESEYNFDETEDDLMEKKNDKMNELQIALKKREHISMLKITKKRVYQE